MKRCYLCGHVGDISPTNDDCIVVEIKHPAIGPRSDCRLSLCFPHRVQLLGDGWLIRFPWGVTRLGKEGQLASSAQRFALAV